MTVKLYEGCCGVTRGGEGPHQIKRNQSKESSATYPWRADGIGCLTDNGHWHRSKEESPFDIIAVFATEPEADAYLAEGHKPLGQLIKEEHTKLVAAEKAATAAPKPVTWPDGVDEMQMISGLVVVVCEKSVSLRSPGMIHVQIDAPRQLAALLNAAADYVDGGGK